MAGKACNLSGWQDGVNYETGRRSMMESGRVAECRPGQVVKRIEAVGLGLDDVP